MARPALQKVLRSPRVLREGGSALETQGLDDGQADLLEVLVLVLTQLQDLEKGGGPSGHKQLV